MAIQKQTIKGFTKGIYNVLPDELIPKEAASDSLNWNTIEGRTELSYGRQLQGGAGLIGKNYLEHTAFMANGTAVRFRKVNGTIQTLVGTTWTDVITGLTATADYVASNYQSLAGSFVFFFGIDGIYKIATANPLNYSSLYVDGVNFKGFGFIDKGRTILWGNAKDPTGFYMSWVDNQRSVSGSTGVYTPISSESLGALGSISYSGTLAFKAGGATRNAFGLQIVATVPAGTETFTDNYNGTLTSNFGGTGTINYMTGDYTLTFSAVTTSAVTANYSWEDSNLRGVTDFRYSATRLAGEGNFLRQDYNGTAIQLVLPLDGSYFSLKKDTCYQVTLDVADVAPTNLIFRTDIGIPTLRSAAGTSQGIMFINTANPSKPRLMLLKRNPLGDNFDAKEILPQFNFANYTYDDCLLFSWDRYILISCKEDSLENNRLIMGNILTGAVDVSGYGIRTATQAGGYLYGGDPITKSTYELFTGFDDLEQILDNYWISNAETYGSDVLKKVKKLRFMGRIDPQQALEIYVETDNSGEWQLIGTIRGSGGYVDLTTSYAIGTSLVGEQSVGGGGDVTIYGYFLELKVKLGKFRKRKIKFKAIGFGYVSVQEVTDFDIWTFQDKMPAHYRQKQNVSLDGEDTNVPNPEY